MDTSRVLVYSHDDTFLFELTPAEQTERTRRECINGEHSLTITCLRELEKEQRLLTVDGMGKWREYVVMGLKSAHSSSNGKKYTYKCVWSLQHDLSGVRVNKMVGTQTPCTAAYALGQLLSETQRWSVGTVTQSTTGGVSMYYVNGWKAMQLLVGTWGGEVDADIEVNKAGVVSRSVSLYSKQGNQSATRRFDWAYDLKGISREVSESMVYCRVIPRGKGESVGSGYGRKITIEDVNGGIEWLQDDESAQLYRLRTQTGWEYPTAIIENGSIEEPQALKDWALSVIHDYTRPSVTYRADVSQYAEAGMDVKGVALGDAVQCVDRGFSEDGLRIDGRVTEMVTNELDPADVKLTIGHITEGITRRISQLVNNGSVGEAVRAITGGSTTSDGFLSDLIGRLNGEINADGGYWYMVEGLGTRTYDAAVSDPAVGAEASKVVEIRGGSIRIADSRTSSGDWDWRSVFVAGHIAAELVTAAQITTGYIGSSNGTYIDLDNNTATFGPTSGYHFTVDVNGITFYNGQTQLGKYLASSTILGNDTSAHLEVDSDSLEVYGGNRNGSPVLVYSAGYHADSSYIHLSDYTGTCYINLDTTGFGSSIVVKGQSSICAFLGWDSSKLRTRYDLGQRKANTDVGTYSLVGGVDNTATGAYSTAFGYNNVASGERSIVGGQNNSCDSINALVIGHDNTAGYSSNNVLITGAHNAARVASGQTSSNGALIGEYLELYANHKDCLIVGKRNWDSSSNVNDRFVVGNGSYIDGSSYVRNLLRAGGPDNTDGAGGYMILSGTMTAKEYATSSDRRLKEHVAYLGDEACEFVRSLKPALYAKDGARHVGFYAQDVRDSEPDEWDTVTVSEWHTEESADFDTLTLDYNALIAPLVAYTQHLERRIEEQEKMISSLVKRLEKLEGTIR